MTSNLTLIGMPGAGKSTIGIILAKTLGLGFVDTDVLIQVQQGRTLQQIMNQSGYLGLRDIEAETIMNLMVRDHVIATGGSAVYSKKAMAHLGDMSTIIFLDVDMDEIQRRIHNFTTRGIAKAADQSFEALFQERHILYTRYADMVIDCRELNQDQVADKIAGML